MNSISKTKLRNMVSTAIQDGSESLREIIAIYTLG